jgi:hypothetical protein
VTIIVVKVVDGGVSNVHNRILTPISPPRPHPISRTILRTVVPKAIRIQIITTMRTREPIENEVPTIAIMPTITVIPTTRIIIPLAIATTPRIITPIAIPLNPSRTKDHE